MKILVPVDGSDCALRAAEHVANWIEANPEIEATIVHIKNSHWDPSYLDRAVKVFKDRNLKVKAWLVDSETDPALEIARIVEREKFDHIVMGRRGLGAVQALFVGSVSQKVLHLVDVPVMLVK